MKCIRCEREGLTVDDFYVRHSRNGEPLQPCKECRKAEDRRKKKVEEVRFCPHCGESVRIKITKA